MVMPKQACSASEASCRKEMDISLAASLDMLRMCKLVCALVVRKPPKTDFHVSRSIWLYSFLIKTKVNFVRFDSLRPINNLSVKQGRVLLGLTSTKLGQMCLSQGPQRSDAGEARTRGHRQK